MHRLQEVIRLHRLGRSGRAIARQLRMGRETTRQYLQVLASHGLLEGSVENLPSPESLLVAIGSDQGQSRPPQQVCSIQQWVEKIKQLRKDAAGPTAIHDHLRLQYESQYAGSLSAVKRLCRRLDRESGPVATDVVIPVATAAGEVAQVDFGYAGQRYDPERGVTRKCWVFVMTLGYSRHMFAHLVFDQKVETWLGLHIAGFESFGGVPRVLVPDNLKAAVIRAAFGVDDEPTLNRSYCELARHYGFQIDPTPPRSPQKKGKVEAGVRYVKRNFLATWKTVDIHEDRRQLHRWVHQIAGHRRHGTTGERPVEVFEQRERDQLRSLPTQRWEPVIWKKATVHRDSHVQIDGALYSVPWPLLHQQVWVRCTTHQVMIHHQDKHVYTHASTGRGQRRTVDEHLPEHRRDLRHRSRSYWIQRAKTIGDHVERLAEMVFESDDVLLQLRKVQAIVTHLEKFPRQRAQAAAKRAIFYGCIDYRSIKNILSRALDLQAIDEPTTRTWSSGSRFARIPNTNLFNN